MKRSATKILVAVLCLSMVLGTSMSALAAATVGNTDVKVNFITGATTVSTSVTTDAEEKVTYMVHDAADFYSVTKDNVKYIDQKTINGTDTFQYTTNAFGANDVVYVGGDSLAAPTTSTTVTGREGLTIKINEVVVDNAWAVENNYVKVTMANAADVTAVTLGADGATATNYAVGNGVLYVMLPDGVNAWTESLAVINIATATAEDVASPIVIKAIDLINYYTPADYGVINLASGNVGSISQAGHSTAINHAFFGQEGSYTGSIFDDSFIEGDYSYTAKAKILTEAVDIKTVNNAGVAGNATLPAGKAALIKDDGSLLYTTSADENSTFYANAIQSLEDQLIAILSDIENGVANAAVTDNGDGTYTINSTVSIKKAMGKMYLPVSTPLTKTVYVAKAGDYKVLALYNPSATNRYVGVEVNGTKYVIGGTEGLDANSKTTYQNPTGADGAVLDGDVIHLEKGFQEIGVYANNTSLRFAGLALVPVEMVNDILTAVNGTEGSVIKVTRAIWDEYIEANVAANANVASGAKLGPVYLNSDSLLAYAKVIGGNAGSYGIRVNTGKDVDVYEAIAVGNEGAFAIEVEGDGVNMLTLYEGAKVSAFADAYRSAAKVATENEFVAE